MIGNLTFNSICEMVLNERVAKFQYIKLDPEIKKELEDTLSEKEQTFFEVTIPNTVKKGLRIKKVMGAADIDFDEPISEMDHPDVKSAKQLYQERVKMYRDVFLNIKYVVNNMPSDPDNPDSTVQGLKINELFSTCVSPSYKVIKLQMNQFKNFMSGMTKNTDTVKWDSNIESFVSGSSDIDTLDRKPIDPLTSAPGEEDDSPVSDKEIEFGSDKEIPVIDDDLIGPRERIPVLGDDDYWKSIGMEDDDDDDDELDDNALGIDDEIDSAYNDYKRANDFSDY